MTVCCCKLRRVLNPILAVVPDVVSLLKQIHTWPSPWLAAIDLEKALSPFLSISPTRGSGLPAAKTHDTPSKA